MIVTPGATVDHLAALIDHRESHVIAVCGEEGHPIDRDVEELDRDAICGRCLAQIEEDRIPETLRLPDFEELVDDGENGD